MKKLAILLPTLAIAVCCSKNAATDYASFVDPMIGCGGHGHVFVGANVPFGAIQLGPTSVPTSWDWCSGYHDSDSTLIGFSHTHLSGTGVGDLFDVTVLPLTAIPDEWTRQGQADIMDRSQEVCIPGYYKVKLARSGVMAEMTATERVGLHRYVFPKGSDAFIAVDLENGGCHDKTTFASLRAIDERHFEGCRFSKGWASDQRLFFSGEFDRPFDKCDSIAKDHWLFSFTGADKVQLKLSVSPASIEGAAGNIAAELPGWNFDNVRDEARGAWNAELGKVNITTADENARKIFYTSLFHTMTAPSLFCDSADSAVRYTTLSLWDTYRAQMPLYTILHAEKEADIVNTFLDIFDAQGKLPVWHLHGCETDCMVGTPGIPVLADAILKDFSGFDRERAYSAMKASALLPERGQSLRMKYGYIPCDLFKESVAYELEYALSDWSLAQVAAKLGHVEDYEYFLDRSRSYQRHFDPATGFMRGVTSTGLFREPFDPFSADHRNDDYCEGNAWQYTFLVPHDFKGLCDCFARTGEYDNYIDRKKISRIIVANHLDSLFNASSDISGENVSPDISGLIGQYAHGNEPSHHIAYFYTMAGQPWKTADIVRRICAEQYSCAHDGLSGNEDVGQMSAWYILSAMGFYQVEPAGGRYWFGAPLFDNVTISLGGGRTFSVKAENLSEENRYIQRIFLNDRPYTKPYVEYNDIVSGGTLRFVMGTKKTIWYCADEPDEYVCQRPAPQDRLFTSPVIDSTIAAVQAQLTNPRLRWMFGNCFPNTLDTTVHYAEDDGNGHPDTFVYTGDIHAMWLRDSGAQVWPYLRFSDDPHIRSMLEGTIRRQFKCLCIDPYANAFNFGPTGSMWSDDNTLMLPELHERKWEIDSQCYPIRLAYEYWKKTGDESIFDETWLEAIQKVYSTLRTQQRKEGRGPYWFTRKCDAQYDMKSNCGYGNPVNPVGLIVSSFRPSDDATIFDFLIPSNFFAVTSLRKAAEILESVNAQKDLASDCRALADEVAAAIQKYAVVENSNFGKIYAYEVDGFGNHLMMDDANVPSLLAMAYLGDVDINDPIYQNTRKFVLSSSNPYRFEGAAGAGIGGPHIGSDYIWPMSFIMRVMTSEDDAEIQDCILTLMTTDAGKGFMHESFHVDEPAHFTRDWFAWQNTLFGEMILHLIDEGKLELLNQII